ncbi:protein AKNAD1 [Pteronotus mesoamericanus]|uniref:protein AKNAD1 n=1 Tax=Pteronotus mesoamericanus TaxID=1884717 RepID=UPI0023EDF0BA|nr:protein AKNAD1 [Pteronotus parnellii mesoamericanus]
MDEADFSEGTTWKPQAGLPHDGGASQTELWDDHHLSLENDLLDVSDQISSAVEDSQGEATPKGTCRNADTALTLGKRNENAVKRKYDKGQPCTTNPHVPAGGDLPKSNISDILQRHLSKEEFLKGEGINCETLPEISNADTSDEAIIKNVILRYVKNSWPKEPTSELPGQLDPKRGGGRGAEPGCSPSTAEESTSVLEETVTAGDGSHRESSNFLPETKRPSHKLKGCQRQTPQNQQTEKTRSDHGFNYDQVHYRFSDFSNVAPAGNIHENNIIDKPLPIDKQASFSPELRDRLALVQGILESLSRANYVEKEEQEKKASDPFRQTEMEPTRHIHQEHLAGIESETSLSKLTSTSQKDPSSSSSYIFQKISQGKKMCQQLREQTDRLKSKVQEFSKSIAQDSPCHVQDERQVLEKLQGHPGLLEQEFVASEEKHLTLKQQAHRHEPRAGRDFDPERKGEGEIFRVEVLPEEARETTDESRRTPAGSRKQSMEKKGLRRTSCGRFPIALQEQTPHSDSMLSSNTELSCCSASGTGLQSNKCETCGTKIPNSPRGCWKEPLREFHYRYNMPGQNYGGGSAFVQLRFLNENKNSSPSCSKSNWIYSERANSKSSQDEPEPIPGKNNLTAPMTYSSDLASSSSHFHSCRISGRKSSGNFSSIQETKCEGLHSSLDNALRTAIVLKETTDRMIRTIAEDLAKVQRWRNRLKY